MPTATPTPAPTATVAPTPSPTIAPTPSPTATPTPGDAGDYLIISRADLLALPTSGAAWTSIVNSANTNVTTDLCDQNNKADVSALAAGIVYARTGDASYRTHAINLIDAAMTAQRDGCDNAVLALGRQLGGYVMAADFADYHDSTFTSWLDQIRTRNIGGQGRWFILRDTSRNSANNWGTFALASSIAADRFLGDATNVAIDWQVFAGYDGSWPFQKTSSWNEDWSCVADTGNSRLPVAINPPCVKSGVNLDGAPVEDASRSDFPTFSTYIHEALQGYVVQAQLLSRAGYDGWGTNDAQVCRAAQFANRAGRLNDWSGANYVAWMANHFCGLSLPTATPTSGGRVFGFADWLFG